MSIAPSQTTTQTTITNGTALAKRKFEYQALAPVGSAQGLKSMLDTMRDSIAQALPKHVTPERLIKTLLVAANRTPKLLECTQASILETINRAAELGLDLSGTLGEAYPVPFNNKIKDNGRETWVTQCQLIIGYRGFEKLAWQSGEVAVIDAEVVCENDDFVFRKGFEPVLSWAPCMKGDRGEPVGAYAMIELKNGGRMARFMPVSDIERIRAGAQSKDSPAWRNHWMEMARKTALRRVLKDAPLSTEKLTAAMEQDDRDYQLADVLEAETVRRLPTGRSSFKDEPQDDAPEPQTIGASVQEHAERIEQLREQAKQATQEAPRNGEATSAPSAAEGHGEESGDSAPAAGNGAASTSAGKRSAWTTDRPTPAHPAYWLARLEKSAASWLESFGKKEAPDWTAADMVRALESGAADPHVPVLPSPETCITADEIKKAAQAYRAANHFVESSPDHWRQVVSL